MSIDRRQFLQGAAALFCAPAIVKAENIMKIWTPRDMNQAIWTAYSDSAVLSYGVVYDYDQYFLVTTKDDGHIRTNFVDRHRITFNSDGVFKIT